MRSAFELHGATSSPTNKFGTTTSSSAHFHQKSRGANEAIFFTPELCKRFLKHLERPDLAVPADFGPYFNPGQASGVLQEFCVPHGVSNFLLRAVEYQNKISISVRTNRHRFFGGGGSEVNYEGDHVDHAGGQVSKNRSKNTNAIGGQQQGNGNFTASTTEHAPEDQTTVYGVLNCYIFNCYMICHANLPQRSPRFRLSCFA